MPNDELISLRTEIQTLATQAKGLHANMEVKAAKGESTAEDATRFEALIKDGQTKRARYDNLVAIANLETLTEPAGAPQTLLTGAARGLMGHKSPGQLFLESKEYQGRKANTDPYRVQDVEIGSMRNLLGGTVALEQKDIYMTTTSQTIGTLAPPVYEPEILDIARQRPPSMIDLVPMTPINAPAVFYVLFTARTNAAAPTAEYTGGNFGLKPKSDMTFSLVEAQVKTIPTYVLASRTLLDDAPQLAAQINNELAYDVRVVLEDQMISGDGTGANFTGILSTAGIQTRVMSASAPSGRGQTTADTKADTLRRAITDLQLAFYEPTGIVLNPGDAEALELQKDSQGRYLMIFDPVTNRLWRVATVVTAAMPALTAVVANFQIGMKLWDRQQTTIRVGEPNDMFLRNAVAILAELRAAFAVTRPLAVEKVTLI